MKNEKKFINEALKIFIRNSDNSVLNKLYQNIDVSTLKALIVCYEIAGIFYNAYLEKIFDSLNLPPDFINFLKKNSGRNTLINSLHENELIKITKKLESENIDYFYVKGASVRKKCFDNDYATSSADIDLFIRYEDYKTIKELITKMGYKIPTDYYNKIIKNTSFAEYEKKEGEICFTKKEGVFKLIVDFQWDLINHDKTNIFHQLYNLKKFYDFNKSDFILLDSKKIKTLPLESEFINMSFHYAFHHGFNGIKWFIELCLFLKRYEEKIDFDYILENADFNLKKILGIIMMLVYNFNYGKELSRKQKKLFYVDKLLPYEFIIFKNMTTRIMDIKAWSKNLRIIKILLPYHRINGFRIIKKNILLSLKTKV